MKEFRFRKGWSKAELARQASLSPSTIGLIENGRLKPYQIQLEKIAHALGIPISQAAILTTSIPDQNSEAIKYAQQA